MVWLVVVALVVDVVDVRCRAGLWGVRRLEAECVVVVLALALVAALVVVAAVDVVELDVVALPQPLKPRASATPHTGANLPHRPTLRTRSRHCVTAL